MEGTSVGRAEGPRFMGATELCRKTSWSLESASVPLLECSSGLPSSMARPGEGASIDCRE